MAMELLKHHIIESIKLLASDGEIQLSYYPEFVCKGDEIANSLGDWLLMYQNKSKSTKSISFSTEEMEQIVNLDAEIGMLEPDDFSDYAILNSCKWENIRNKAKKTLTFLKEKYSLPDQKSV